MHDRTGQWFGNYRVTRKLGEGGMGAVYEAIHPELGRRVAIKVILPSLTRDEQSVARFLREGRAANRVVHPGLVEILDQGRLATGELYLAMEYLDGETLGDRVARIGPLPLGQALDILAQCAGALDALHDAGMVHRDLKPDNIYLMDGLAGVSVKILDFGLVKLRDESDAAQTASGAIMGTPLYMSPEQCESTRSVDARTDVYAMACIVYFLLAGRPPFDALAPGPAMIAHMQEEPPLISQLRPDLPATLDAVLTRALAKKPSERFARAGELVRAMSQATLRPPTHRGGLTTLQGSAGQTTPRRHRPHHAILWSLVGIVGIATLAGIALWHLTTPSDHVSEQNVTLPTDAPTVMATLDAQAPPEGYRLWSSGRPRDAYVTFLRDCRGGDADGCENAVYAIARGGVDEDAQYEALAEVARDCAAQAAACVAHAVLSSDREAARRACEAGVPTGCLIVASHHQGSERAFWAARSIDTLDEQRHIDAGYIRGLLTLFGLGVSPSVHSARAVLANACLRVDPSSCGLVDCLSFDPRESARIEGLSSCYEQALVGEKMFQLLVEEAR